ncbi:MAG: enoyl-CoA hydratase/isomerase family protein [Rhodoblastus sp.]|nr:enoyl-CoA hydratase/isomerase family protein [Rhodoblastus sp.]
MSAGRIEARAEGPIGWVTFDNQKRRNAMSLGMWTGLTAALERFAADPSVRVVILRGAGETAFVSGADISEFDAHRSDAAAAAEYARATDGAWKALGAFEKPMIAMIQGFCFGGGVAIAMKADLRIAADNSLFAIPAARLGIAYPTHSVRDLVALVGPAKAKEILYTGMRLDAGAALAIGLVNRVMPVAHLEAEVAALCATIAENAPLTIRAAKETIDQIARDEHDPKKVAERVAACFDSADYAEGRRAFMEKRRPQFTGR